MTRKLRWPIEAQQLAKALGRPLLGPNRSIVELCSLETLCEHGLSFVLHAEAPAPHDAGGTVFAAAAAHVDGMSVIATEHPRLDFIRAQYLIDEWPGFLEDSTPPRIHPTARVGQGTIIEKGVSIGQGTVVGCCVVIRSGTRIGRFCEIKSGAVIGEPGFGFERDEANHPIKMIHLGGVLIGDFVEIGALTTVVRGALGDTVLEDYVKLDDHVHVAHNCHVGKGAMITACAELSGSVRVGKNAWLAPNCSVIQKVELGDDSFIGIGAVVAKDVEAGSKVVGNPARKIPSSGPDPHAAPLHPPAAGLDGAAAQPSAPLH